MDGPKILKQYYIHTYRLTASKIPIKNFVCL